MNDSFEANKRKEYFTKACEKIFEVVHFYEEQYICKEQMLAEYFAWNGDNLSPLYAHYDNCLYVQAELVHEIDVKTDAIKMVEVVEEIINKLHESEKLISPKDIIQIYCQLNRRLALARLAYNTWNSKNNDKLVPVKSKWKYIANKYLHSWCY
ncbi:17435_t:CDS:2 [Rhizophagus irregularis]|nr:17435_t:CDS:2 [Rhizophagus irregularis]